LAETPTRIPQKRAIIMANIQFPLRVARHGALSLAP
jgi:hypothetical protein